MSIRSTCLLFCLLCLPLLAAPPEVLLNGDRITIRARENTLAEVLQQLADDGVEVRVDPGVEARVHGDLVNEDVGKAMDLLLKNFGYTTRWRTIKGPVGNISALKRVDVYRVGYSQSVRQLKTERKRFDVVRDPDGVMYVRDEVLVGVKAGTSKEQFMAMVGQMNGRVVASNAKLGVYRIKLPPNSPVRNIASRIVGDYPFAKVEPNYAIQQPGPSPTSPADVAAVANLAPASPGVSSAVPGGSAGSAAAVAAAPAAADNSTSTSANPAPKAPAEGVSPVAIFDSGLLADNWYNDLVQSSFDATEPGATMDDTVGHGTQMGGIATGATVPKGVTPNPDAEGTPIIALRTFDDAGLTSNFAMMDAINHAGENGARVLSMSWGSETSSEFLQTSIQAAQQQGLVVVAAVGNTPNGQPSYPAAYDGVVGVGALTGTGEIWQNSNYGDFVDVSAPGQADFPVGHEGPPGSYSGTSISTPYVARAFSQYLAINPDSSTDDMLKAFYGSLSTEGTAGQTAQYGQGRFDDAAVARFLAGQ